MNGGTPQPRVVSHRAACRCIFVAWPWPHWPLSYQKQQHHHTTSHANHCPTSPAPVSQHLGVWLNLAVLCRIVPCRAVLCRRRTMLRRQSATRPRRRRGSPRGAPSSRPRRGGAPRGRRGAAAAAAATASHPRWAPGFGEGKAQDGLGKEGHSSGARTCLDVQHRNIVGTTRRRWGGNDATHRAQHCLV